MRNSIRNSLSDSLRAIESMQSDEVVNFIESLAEAITTCYQNGGKLIIAGNGGSLCDAMHFAEELTGFYREKRPALPALALADPGHISCVGNDVGFESIFSRGVEAHGKKGDLFIALTTSGNSENIVRGVEAAQSMGLTTVGFLGKGGGKLKGRCDLEWIVSGFKYSDRIQEAHMTAIHIVIEQVEVALFSEAAACD